MFWLLEPSGIFYMFYFLMYTSCFGTICVFRVTIISRLFVVVPILGAVSNGINCHLKRRRKQLKKLTAFCKFKKSDFAKYGLYLHTFFISNTQENTRFSKNFSAKKYFLGDFAINKNTSFDKNREHQIFRENIF